jgi:hypothetical protein
VVADSIPSGDNGVNRREPDRAARAKGQQMRCETRVMRNPLGCIVGCGVIAVLLTVSALPFAFAQPQQQAATLTGEELVELAEELQQEVEQLRGWKFKHPVKTGLCSEQQLRQFVEKKGFEDEYGPDGLPLTQAFLRMVGLIPPDCDLRQTILDVLLNQAGGFYDPTTKTFYIVSQRCTDYGPLVNRIMIAHELTHALDDQYVNLDRLAKSRPRTEDWGLAIGAVIEGSATALMSRYGMKAIQSGDYDASELMQVVRQEQDRSRAFLEAPPYFSSLLSTYICGMFFLTAGEPGGLAGSGAIRNVGARVLQAAKDPPVSTEQVLHPAKYWDRAKRDYPVEVSDADVEALLKCPGLHVVHRDTVGELLCALLTVDENRVLEVFTASLPNYWTNDAATGWGGDRFFLLAEGHDAAAAGKSLRGVKGVWVTLWDTPDDRDEFVEEYELERTLPSRSVFRLSDRGAVFLFGFDPVQRADTQRRFERHPPGFTRDGKPWNPGR